MISKCFIKELTRKAKIVELKPGTVWSEVDPAYGMDKIIYQNICIWYDGTLKIMRGHHGDCKWQFDEMVWKHL